MVPLLWGIWIKIKKSDEKISHSCGGCEEDHDHNKLISDINIREP